ncbi:protein of unknown function [uncultured Sphingopyxis sp.]|uniref:Uncharacterized protein n=1 Tax=uncultured Sphingopyxis sp. TaxID=310581 RepID=A0A1Y5PRI3_9SPHN|nr:protein of unknown function [uncultured Sphingopyxis sp.]
MPVRPFRSPVRPSPAPVDRLKSGQPSPTNPAPEAEVLASKSPSWPSGFVRCRHRSPHRSLGAPVSSGTRPGLGKAVWYGAAAAQRARSRYFPRRLRRLLAAVPKGTQNRARARPPLRFGPPGAPPPDAPSSSSATPRDGPGGAFEGDEPWQQSAL